MKVRPNKKASYKGEIQAEPARAHPFPAPIRGLVLNENIANPGPAGALVLDNWICTTKSIRVRGGSTVHVTLPTSVTSIFSYLSGGAEKFFASTINAVYDISTTTPASVITGQTSGTYNVAQFGTAGGDYLYAVNGADKAQLFDGVTWTAVDGASTPAITGVTTSNLSHVWTFASRLLFVEKDTTTAWFLPVDSIGGTASAFSLAGTFKKGGSLLFGATWSLDAGDGLDDKCVFVSTEGEVAVFEGTNPGSAADFRKVGVYQISKPLGPKAIMQAGGDLLIAMETGLVPISQAVQRDVAALETAAVSSPITPLWQQQVADLSAEWEIVKWPRKNIMLVSQPGDAQGSCLVANLETGAWSRFTGIDTQCLGMFDDSAFYGTADGRVLRMETGGSDDGAPYTSAYLGLHEGMGAPGVEKTVGQVRAVFRKASPILPKITAQVDYSEKMGIPPNAASDPASLSLWGSATWDESKWGDGGRLETIYLWRAVGRTGFVVAPEVQLTFGDTATPVVELVAIDATYQVGALVT